VRGDAVAIATGVNYGVAGTACNAQVENYAVYGLACSSTSGNWAGYFDGPTFSPGAVWTASDENLKTNISDLGGATEMLMSLAPKSYFFDANIDALTLPEGLQYGLIAQELELVIPHAVREVTTPERLDEEGNVLVESIDIKAVNYSQLIPLLIAGFKEQNDTEANNMAQIEELQSRLANLENSIAITTERISSQTDQAISDKVQKARINQNFPNPFEETTAIEVEVFEEGSIRVDVVNENGEVIETLRNQTESPGSFELIWNASGQPEGVYFCIIRHNGDIQVKKMIKQ
jgi:hypothetical protein